MQTTYLLKSGKLSLDKPRLLEKLRFLFFEIKYCLYEELEVRHGRIIRSCNAHIILYILYIY